MAATIARATGHDSTRTKEKHTLGSVASTVEAATYRTFAEAEVYADGHGEVLVRRDGEVIHRFEFGPEDGRPTLITRFSEPECDGDDCDAFEHKAGCQLFVQIAEAVGR
jgi:hypothetical protein